MLVSVVSCLKDTETEKTPQAAITSFVVGYYNVRYQDIDQQGNDSITYYRGGGVLFPMTIDQINNRIDRKSTRLNSSHSGESRMPSSA